MIVWPDARGWTYGPRQPDQRYADFFRTQAEAEWHAISRGFWIRRPLPAIQVLGLAAVPTPAPPAAAIRAALVGAVVKLRAKWPTNRVLYSLQVKLTTLQLGARK